MSRVGGRRSRLTCSDICFILCCQTALSSFRFSAYWSLSSCSCFTVSLSCKKGHRGEQGPSLRLTGSGAPAVILLPAPPPPALQSLTCPTRASSCARSCRACCNSWLLSGVSDGLKNWRMRDEKVRCGEPQAVPRKPPTPSPQKGLSWDHVQVGIDKDLSAHIISTASTGLLLTRVTVKCSSSSQSP